MLSFMNTETQITTRRKALILGMAVIASAIVLAFVGWSAMGRAATVWDGFDPKRPNLDVEILRTQIVDDVEVQVLRYTSEIWEGKPIRVLGMYGRPKGEGKFPAILHFHGGGQTASALDIAECVKRGYACFSFDWTGPKLDRTEVTEWPASIKTHFEPDRANKLYHAVIAGRRGITFLEGRPEVDASRIGEYGISWGGYCTWLLNGTDTRLKVCVPVYGCGDVLVEERRKETVGSNLGDRLEDWMCNFEPLRYGPTQHAPLLYVNGANDFFGWVTAGRDMLQACKVPTRQVYTPGINHGVGPEASAAAYAWLAHYLQGGPALPASPSMEVRMGAGGEPEAVVTVDRESAVVAVRIDYSIGDAASPGRCWRRVDARKVGNRWFAPLPIFDVIQPLHAIAQVNYREGYRLSGVPLIVVPKDLGAVTATLVRSDLISDFTDGIGGWASSFQSTQLYGARQDVALEPAGYDGKPCLRVVALIEPSTHFTVSCWRPGDPQWNGGSAAGLSFWIRGAEKAVGIVATERVRRPGEAEFRSLVRLKPDKGWLEVVVRREDLRGAAPPAGKDGKAVSGRSLGSWNDVQLIEINGSVAAGEKILIGPARWLQNVP